MSDSLAAAAAEAIATRTRAETHDVALVIGSGWAPAADLLGEVVAEVETDHLPGFAPAAVAGHVGRLRSVQIGMSNRRAMVFLSRTHLYEGRGVRPVVHSVRTAAAAGCSTIVLTNGSGGLRPEWAPGTPVLITDHINLTGVSPVEGANFIDLTDLYSARLRELAHSVDPTLPEGIYVQFPGPHYETPAEVRMARGMGGDLVGMSTALEAIAARESGLEILGVSLVTNHAAGISDTPLSHEEVLDTGRAATQRCGTLLAEIVRRILE
jgi:purine-nucleoside phosphorylase